MVSHPRENSPLGESKEKARLNPSCVVVSLCVLLSMCGLLQFARTSDTALNESAADRSDRVVSGPWVVCDGFDGPGKGIHVVLVSGDEEYRSEEAFPQLGKILALHHGFKCTVLFNMDPDSGTIDPDNTRNIPGLEALRSADFSQRPWGPPPIWKAKVFDGR